MLSFKQYYLKLMTFGVCYREESVFQSIKGIHDARVLRYSTKERATEVFMKALADQRVVRVSEVAMRHRIPPDSPYPSLPSDRNEGKFSTFDLSCICFNWLVQTLVHVKLRLTGLYLKDANQAFTRESMTF